MDVTLHTLIAVGCLVSSFYIGTFFANQNLIEHVISQLMKSLEEDGFIKIIIDKDGDKTIVPIAEIEVQGDGG